MQVGKLSFYQEKISELKNRRQDYRQTQTVRGNILDRNSEKLATNKSQFRIHISYQLCRFLDERVRKAKLAKASQRDDAAVAVPETKNEINKQVKQANEIIEKLTRFGQPKEEILEKIESINDNIWNLRGFLAWARNDPDPELIEEYGGITSVPASVAFSQLEKQFPDEDERLARIISIDDIPKVKESFPLLTLKNQDDIFTAQIEFMQTDGVEILPAGKRTYPYGETAGQTIGWVGPATQPEDTKLFASDRLSRYLAGEVCGREDGCEYVCESILRGRRGEIVYDIDDKLVKITKRRFGKDVQLTLDIELQKELEELLNQKADNVEDFRPKAAAVMKIRTGEILALASVPSFDPSRLPGEYSEIIRDPAKPMINRAINKRYPPGSVVKPLIAVAGLQENKITPGKTIKCLAHEAPNGWPSCWITREGVGHTTQWAGEGGNNAINAIKGSCNIYFSRLADRIEPRVLQSYLWMFGYGRSLIEPPEGIERNFRQTDGVIASSIPKKDVKTLSDVGDLTTSERRWFGIGQGNLRVSPLQVTASMATIARGGNFKQPILFTKQINDSNGVSFGIAREVIKHIRKGMYGVVNEYGGTAYTPFRSADFEKDGVTVYGKTGSTEAPENAWFAGFAEYEEGKGIALSVIVEGGESGSHDAAPLGRKIIEIAQKHGYLSGN